MTWIAVRAAFGALIVALLFSGSDLVSVGIWLASAAALVGLELLIHVIKAAEVEPAQIAVAWTWRFRRRPIRQMDRRPDAVGAIEGLVASAIDYPNLHASRLRPRLTELADHFLPIRQGIDSGSDPARAKALLGDVAWLVDSDVSDRSPTVHELDRFLDIVLAEEPTPTQTNQAGSD